MMDGWKRVQDSNHDSSLSRTFSKFLQVSESALVHVVVTSQRALSSEAAHFFDLAYARLPGVHSRLFEAKRIWHIPTIQHFAKRRPTPTNPGSILTVIFTAALTTLIVFLGADDINLETHRLLRGSPHVHISSFGGLDGHQWYAGMAASRYFSARSSSYT